MDRFEIITAAAKKAIERIDELENLIASPEVGADKNYLLTLAKEHAQLSPIIELCSKLDKTNSKAESDNILLLVGKLLADLNDYKYEEALIEIYGERSYDNARRLMQAYKDYAENNCFEFILAKEDFQNGFYQIELNGVGAYSCLKKECGNHLFDKKRVPVLVFESKKVDYKFSESDIRIDYFHSGGAGGQNVNKVESAIRATHLPTKISVVCQDERSQFKNKERALSNLEKRVIEFYQKQNMLLIKEEKRKAEKLVKDGIIAREYDFAAKKCFNDNASIIVQIKNDQIILY